MNENLVPGDFYDVLDDCLEAVLSGARTVAECLAEYPDFAAELKPELQIALLTSRLNSPAMEAASVEALEIRLRTRMDDQNRARKVIRLGSLAISRAAAAVMIVFLLAFGSGAGLVAASADTVPGDTLYPVKRLWEALLLLLAPLFGQVDDVWLQLAETRLDEVLVLNDEGRLDEASLTALYEAISKAILYADADTTPRAVAYLQDAEREMGRIQPSPNIRRLYADVVAILQPVMGVNGSFQPLAYDQPPSLLTPSDFSTPTFTATARVTATSRASITPAATATFTPSEMPTVTDTYTPSMTPLFPATATFTPSATPAASETPSPTLTPSATWTPLPLPGGVTAAPPAATTGPQVTNTVDSSTLTPTPNTFFNPWLRETQRSVYMTQTAGPPPTEEPPSG